MTFKDIVKKSDLKTSLILLSVPVILTVYLYHGMHRAFGKYFPSLRCDAFFDMYSYIYEYLTAFILLFVLPVFIIKVIFKENLKDYALGLGDVKYGLRFTILAIIIVLPILFIGTQMHGIQTAYPQAKSVINKTRPFIILEFFYLFYYIGWEFFFRGYMLLGLREKLGDFYAILIQTIPSCIMHIGKPEGEFIGSIIAGIVFGYLVIRTRSIWYPLLIHLFIGIATDVLVVAQFY